MIKLQHSIFYTVFLFGFLLPFSTNFSNMALIFFYVLAIFLFFAKKLNVQKDTLKMLKYSTLLLIIPCFISFAVSDAPAEVLNILGRRITFLLTPVVFLLVPQENLKVLKHWSLKGLLYGGIASSLYLIINILYEYYLTRPLFTIDEEMFGFYYTGHSFIKSLDIHPSYYGLYLILALAFLLYRPPFKSHWLRLFCIAVITTCIVFLNSRLVMAVYFLIILFFLWRYFHGLFKRKRMAFLYSILLFFIIVGAFFFAFKRTYTSQRLTQEAVWELTYGVDTNYNMKMSGDSRLARWDAAWEVIQDKPLAGQGVDKEQDVLIEKYKEMGMDNASEQRYNAHNQFLGTAIEGGILSLLFMILFFYGNFKYSFKSKDTLGIFFITSVFLICLIENYLERNAGIIFVAFYGTLFFFSNFLKEKNI